MTLQEQIRSNRLRSGLVVFGFVLLLAVLAGLVTLALDISLGVLALGFAAIYGVFALVRSRSLIAGLTHAQEIAPEAVKPLRRLVENVSIAAGLAVTPEVRIVEDSAPNAYAAGLRPEKSYVGVTTGLLATMPQRELEAVLAHEVSHIRNRDTYLMTIATVFAGVIALIADVGFRAIAYGGRSRRGGALIIVVAILGFILAPYAALLLRMSLSRRREFLADAGAAEILNDPEAMALALRRLAQNPSTIRYAEASTAHLWVESPTDRVDSQRRGVLALTSWFNTHPAMDARIAALEEAGGFRLPETLPADESFGVEHGLV
ncbi:MAG: M48 family metallopeptidase [Actinobacteria bacterium]|nr:M48 family metallopeptidase [Actinomycetota bacterium]